MTDERGTLNTSALEQLLEVIGGDVADLVELIESYLEESPELLRQLQEGISQSQADVVRRAAHTLKSSSRDFGAMGLSQLCATMEHESGLGRLDNAVSLNLEIMTQYAHSRVALQNHLAHLNSERS